MMESTPCSSYDDVLITKVNMQTTYLHVVIHFQLYFLIDRLRLFRNGVLRMLIHLRMPIIIQNAVTVLGGGWGGGGGGG